MGLFRKLSRKSTIRPTTTASNHAPSKDAYRCVQVTPDESGCCQAARALVSQRFLIDDVPILPLDECDMTECRCTYERFGDRRADSRRVSDVAFDIVSQFHDEENRSSASSGRRRDD